MGRYMLVVVTVIYLFSSLTSPKQWCTLQLPAGKMRWKGMFRHWQKSPNIISSLKGEEEKIKKK